MAQLRERLVELGRGRCPAATWLPEASQEGRGPTFRATVWSLRAWLRWMLPSARERLWSWMSRVRALEILGSRFEPTGDVPPS